MPINPLFHLGRATISVAMDVLRVLGTSLRSRAALAAENLFLRTQLAPCRKRNVKPRRASDPLRLTLVLLARCVPWREALTIVQPATLVRWHRDAFRLVWRWRSRPGRRRLPAESQRLICAMARDNPTWGEERIATELLLKFGLQVSPRTVRRYMGRARGGGGDPSRAGGPRWATFVRTHTHAFVACDFCVVVTATFRILYVFVTMEVGSRRLLHVNATTHPSAAWTSSPGKSSPSRTATGSSSTIGPVSIRPGSTQVLPPWVFASCARRPKHPGRIAMVSGSSERSAANASIT